MIKVTNDGQPSVLTTRPQGGGPRRPKDFVFRIMARDRVTGEEKLLDRVSGETFERTRTKALEMIGARIARGELNLGHAENHSREPDVFIVAE